MRYSSADVENLPEIVKKAGKQAASEQKGLFIYGDTGVGKTYALYAIKNKIGKGKVENFVELLSEFRDYIQKGYYNEKIIELCGNDHLIIDDLGAEKTTEFVHEFLYTIVNRRYMNTKATMLATNLSLNEFRDRYGDRILSRISEMCVLVELKGEDRRLS